MSIDNGTIHDIITKEQADAAFKAVEKEIKAWLEKEKANGKTVAPYSVLREFNESVLNRQEFPFCYSARANMAFNAHVKRLEKIVKKIGIDIH